MAGLGCSAWGRQQGHACSTRGRGKHVAKAGGAARIAVSPRTTHTFLQPASMPSVHSTKQRTRTGTPFGGDRESGMQSSLANNQARCRPRSARPARAPPLAWRNDRTSKCKVAGPCGDHAGSNSQDRSCARQPQHVGRPAWDIQLQEPHTPAWPRKRHTTQTHTRKGTRVAPPRRMLLLSSDLASNGTPDTNKINQHPLGCGMGQSTRSQTQHMSHALQHPRPAQPPRGAHMYSLAQTTQHSQQRGESPAACMEHHTAATQTKKTQHPPPPRGAASCTQHAADTRSQRHRSLRACGRKQHTAAARQKTPGWGAKHSLSTLAWAPALPAVLKTKRTEEQHSTPWPP